jgi:hypothetical protein
VIQDANFSGERARYERSSPATVGTQSLYLFQTAPIQISDYMGNWNSDISTLISVCSVLPATVTGTDITSGIQSGALWAMETCSP